MGEQCLTLKSTKQSPAFNVYALCRPVQTAAAAKVLCISSTRKREARRLRLSNNGSGLSLMVHESRNVRAELRCDGSCALILDTDDIALPAALPVCLHQMWSIPHRARPPVNATMACNPTNSNEGAGIDCG